MFAKFRNALFAGLLSWIIVTTALAASPAPDTGGPIHQLRIYEIFEHNKQAFHDRFRDHAMRIMAKYDFRIVAMWESKRQDKTEFVYLLEWPDAATMNARWARFLADPEWIAIKKTTLEKHGALVGEIESRTLSLTEYSPGRAASPLPSVAATGSDGEGVAQLKNAGSDLSRSHAFEFSLHVPSRDAALRATKTLHDQGFTTKMDPSPKNGDWLILAVKTMVPIESDLTFLRKRFESLARREQGSYDGWRADPVK